MQLLKRRQKLALLGLHDAIDRVAECLPPGSPHTERLTGDMARCAIEARMLMEVDNEPLAK